MLAPSPHPWGLAFSCPPYLIHPQILSDLLKITHSLTISLDFQHYPNSLSHHRLSTVSLQQPLKWKWSFWHYPPTISWPTQKKIQSHLVSYKALHGPDPHSHSTNSLTSFPPLPSPLPCPPVPVTLVFLLFSTMASSLTPGPLHLLFLYLISVSTDISMARYLTQ